MKNNFFAFIFGLLFAGLLPATTQGGTDLDEAARVTGVTLAEERQLIEQDAFRKTDGTSNDFLLAIKRHQLELIDLVYLSEAIDKTLESALADHLSEEKMALLMSKNVALHAQILRYKKAIRVSESYKQSGYAPDLDNPADWEGLMCNDEKDCIRLEPITALFMIVNAHIQKRY